MTTATHSIQEMLNERGYLASAFDARVRIGVSPDDVELDQHCDAVRDLDRAILQRVDADASPTDLLLQAKHAMSILHLPEDEAGETDDFDVLATRALKASIHRLAAALCQHLA